MKFPQNRTEIMDQVAAFACGDLTAKEKEPLIRLSLMHWNHVPDQSQPQIDYEGFDPEWISPVKQLDMDSLIDGAYDYADKRIEHLNKELDIISKDLLMHEKKRGVGDDGTANHAVRMNALYDEKEKVVQQLATFNYEVIDRLIMFTFEDAQLMEKVSKIEEIVREIINTDSDFEIAVDLNITQGRDTTSFDFYATRGSVDRLVSTMSTVFNDPEIAVHGADVIIREHHDCIASYKDVGDEIKREVTQKRMKREMESPESELGM